MVTTLTLKGAIKRAQQPEPCCLTVDQCDYTPERIRRFLKTINDLRSECSPIEALRSVYAPCRGYDRFASSGGETGNGSEKAARIIVDLMRALEAGKRTPVEMASFLCPIMNPPAVPAPVDEAEHVVVS